MTTPEYPNERGPQHRDYWNEPTSWVVPMGCGSGLALTIFFITLIYFA
ncbi:hypothetical protein [Corynebacterium sp. H113]